MMIMEGGHYCSLCQSNPPYFYFIFGFHIASSIPLAGAIISGNESPDVLVTVDERRRYHVGRSLRTLVTEKPESFFTIEDLSNVSLDPVIHALEEPMKLFLINRALFHLLARRGGICLHGSAIDYRGQGVVFSGASESGKSTMAASFHQMGHACLSDDHVFVCSHDGKLHLIGDRSPLKLKKDAMDHLNIDLAQRKTAMKKGKYELEACPPAGLKPPLSRIYYLEPDPQRNTIALEKISRMDSLKLLLKNARSERAFFDKDNDFKVIDLICNISGRIPSVNIRYPKKGSFIMTLAQFIELDLNENDEHFQAALP